MIVAAQARSRTRSRACAPGMPMTGAERADGSQPALRLAIFEVLIGLRGEEITDAIIINEAVVLAKKFSGKDAGKFVNGILATLIKQKLQWLEYVHRRRKELKAEAGEEEGEGED